MEAWFEHFWKHMVDRVTGPMQFRLVLQPVMAAFFAIRAGLKDAKLGHSPYFWDFLSRRENRGPLWREAWAHVGRVILLAIGMDLIYQWIVMKWFYPLEALLVALVLALLPYFILRGLTNRIARAFKAKEET